MKQRKIRIGVPSGKVKMALWEGTEDEEFFVVKAIKNKPYVEAYGNKYFLTEEETKTMQQLMKL